MWDTELKGFGVVYHGTGNQKVFVLAYGPKNARRRVTLGTYGPVDVGKARELALAALAKESEGEDPAEIRRRRRAVPTFKLWVTEYLAAVSLRKKRPQVDTWHLLGPRGGRGRQAADSPAMERWGHEQISKITAADVQALLHHIGETHGRIQANRAYASWRACFQAAVRAGHISENPCARVRKFPENPPRQRTFSDEEMDALVVALKGLPLRDRVFFKLLIETGLPQERGARGEVGGCRYRWPAVDAQEPEGGPAPDDPTGANNRTDTRRTQRCRKGRDQGCQKAQPAPRPRSRWHPRRWP